MAEPPAGARRLGGAIINGVSWDVDITAHNPSWLSEIRVGITNTTDVFSGIFLTPGVGNGAPGQGVFSSNGILKFADIGVPDFVLAADGILRFHFFEGYDDVSIDPDGTWNSGTIGVQYVPAPSALALLGLGGLAAARRRRA